MAIHLPANSGKDTGFLLKLSKSFCICTLINEDKLVKSQIRRMCHFDRREKSYLNT